MQKLLLLLLPILIFAAPDATIEIKKDVDQRASITIIDGDTQSSSQSKIAKKIHSIIASDLKISGNFIPDTEYHTGDYDSDGVAPSLRAKEYALKYKFLENGSGAVLIIKLLKASNSKLILEKKYSIPAQEKYPFVAHKATTDINDALGYKSLEWINNYVVYARYTGKKQSEILLADYTFNYTKVVIRGGLNLFPKWASNKQRSIYYTSYESNLPTLYHLDIYSGKRERIVSSEGMLICSDVSRDGKKLLLTMAPDSQPDIYQYSVASGKAQRLTKFSGIDVGGKYSDDEQSITFVSNRMGQPNIYKKPLSSPAVSQLIFHGKKNNSCDTHDDKIIYSSKEGRGRFNLYIANSLGGGVRPLTSTGVNQFPRFAPDGNTVLYIKRDAGVNSIGYIGLQTNQTMMFPLGNRKIQSIDW